jgi:hypothetical protein
VIRAAYQAAGKADGVVACNMAEKERAAVAVDWLLK